MPVVFINSLFFALPECAYTTHLISCIAPRAIVSFGVFFPICPFLYHSGAPIKNLFAHKTTKKHDFVASK